MRSTLIRLIILLALATVAGMAYYLVKRIPEKKQEIPVIQVKRGDLLVQSYVRGELRSVRSTLLTAPNLGASTQVTQLAPAGALVQAKDLVVEFDDSELLASLEDAELEVAQVGENIKKSEADLKIRRNQDQVDLLKARYAVRRAELEVKRNELMSKIDARKNELTLEEAKRAFTKLEEDVKSRLQQGEAELAVLREQQRKASLEVNRVKLRIDQTRVLAPMTGLVAIKENRSGGFFFGQQLPDIREGDQLSPGTPVAEILDLSELEVAARVNEVERASLREGQEVIVRLDALPGKIVHGKIKNLGGTASSNVFSSDPTKKFDCVFAVDMKEMLAQVGATPKQIEHILATAAENAKRFQAGGGAPAGPNPMMVMAFGGAGPGRGDAGTRGRGEAPPGGAMPSEADRQKMREAFEKASGGRNIQQMSPADREKLTTELRQKLGGGGGRPAGGPPAAPAPAPGGPGRAGAGPMVIMGGPPGGLDVASLSLRQGMSQQFTAEDRAKATLPAPPEENSEMDVLLRPGLLVEAEIIVEKIPNTLYVPQTAVFEKSGKDVVYVRTGNRYEQRAVKLGKRTESQVSVMEGLRQGEVVALADMEAGLQPAKKDKGPAKPRPQQPALPGGRS